MLARHEVADGRQAVARSEARGREPQGLNNAIDCVIFRHECSDNATERAPITPAARGAGAARTAHRLLGPGVAIGALGILGFSFSLPATRLAVADLDPWLVAFGRATVAALLAVVYLRATRAPRPTARQARSLAIVALGVVVGFPLFTSLALASRRPPTARS